MSYSPPISSEDARQELMKDMPTKVARKRATQVLVNERKDEDVVPEIAANVRTIPGIITQRGCTYAGCKGVVLGPTRDIVNLTHGPIGCAFYSWLTRRNQTKPETPDAPNYMTYCFSTDMKEEDIVFGGVKRLRKAIQEVYDIMHPKAIAIFSTCPVGLIGDDVHAVAREMKEKLGINIFAFSCEGYRGVSQSAGHHIANNGLFKNLIGLDNTPAKGKFNINILGEYNIGGDEFVLNALLKRCGINLLSTFSGNSTIKGFMNAHMADLNVVMCHRSINYVADMIEKAFGIPWFKVNFIGAEATAKSLRKIAAYFENKKLAEQVEEVIAEEMAKVKVVQDDVKSRCHGKKVMLFVGGSRAHHYQELFHEIGMETLAAGYEFAHRDDYEGRKVLPTIKVDADSRNIEEITVERDATRYNPRKTEAQMEHLKQEGMTFNDYEGMMPQMGNGALVIDDVNHHETEKLLELYHPDIFCAGIKEKYVIQKHGIPCKQLHSYDYGGPYAGFEGAINFYRDIDRMVNTKIWSFLTPPWEKKLGPTLEASFVEP